MIFDCDGVLVDSEPISVSVLIDTISKAGILLDAETVYDRFLGKSMTSICETLSAEYGVDLSEAHLTGLRRELFARFRNELRPVEGVADVLRHLELERCVASSSQPDRIRLSLEITGLIDLAGPDIFSAAMVARGKPAPDLFLYTADQMGVAPSQCVVIEDSPPGIRAAREAGMRVFAFRGASHGTLPSLRAAVADLRPDQTFDRMADLPQMLRSLASPRRRKYGRNDQFICAVDVGTSSARAGIFDMSGHTLARETLPIDTLRHGQGLAEHDSEAVWQAVAGAVRMAISSATVPIESIKALGFDATCSLVFRGLDGQQLPVSMDGESRWDTIAWHDHRAIAEADECSATNSDVLKYVGSSVSPEMQIPKLMWVKQHLPETWQSSGQIFDLADFLTWKATGSTARSQGTLASKWMYQAHQNAHWPLRFMQDVGLADLVARAGLPVRAISVGQPIGKLSETAALDLHLSEACVVATGLVDAHAGILGLLGPMLSDDTGLDRQMALVAGTSNCIGILSAEPVRFAGIWGPYLGSAVDGLWLSESGQSATGALLDHIVQVHGSGGMPDENMHRKIVARVRQLRASDHGDLAPGLHVLPDFNGNRSPLGDPHLRGTVTGIGLDSSFDGLCKLYWRTCVGIALGVRHLVENIQAVEPRYQSIMMTGGHTRNALLLELYRDAIGLPLFTLPNTDAVLLGTAMNAATTAGLYPSIQAATKAMRQENKAHTADPKSQARIERDYKIFRKMIDQRAELRQLQAS